MADKTGIHHQFPVHCFTDDEMKIIRNISREWFVTHGGPAQIASSQYKYALIRPRTIYKEMFNLERELIVVFSPYASFEPRTLDAFDVAKLRIQDLRPENICRVLISKDNDIEKRIDSLLKSDPEQPIVVPFTYDELSGRYDDFFLRNRFRKHFYSRDLFSFFSPLKRDLYFFGRSELVQELVSRHRSGEHTGLFGLRKCGKTSIIYAIEELC